MLGAWRSTTFAAIAVVIALPLAAATTASAATAPTIDTAPVRVPMVFPVVGGASYTDTFLQCRSGCARPHLGQDLMTPKMRPLVAAFTGYISYLSRETVVGQGNLVSVTGDNGWTVNYIHINNDSAGTDDGKGTALWSVMPGLVRGSRVFAGQQIGWSGDSGNAENVSPHTHFELRRGNSWDGTVYNAYASLRAARVLTAAVPSGPHPDGTLVKLPGAAGIWQLKDGLRYLLAPSVLAANKLSVASAITIGRDEMYSYRSGGRAALRDGLVVDDSAGARWVVVDGSRVGVPDGTDLSLIGTTAARVVAVDAAAIDATPLAADQTLPGVVRSGALLRDAGTGGLSLVLGGELRAVPDRQTLTSWGLADADATAVDPALLAVVPVGSVLPLRDGTVAVSTDRSVYVISNGERRLLPAGVARAAYGWSAVPRL
ncbi:MAG: peptidoglycan LD-endopeptidase LytH, partial [Frankiaceae bacterium]|nr:peptidoglycan LD-endopeptidase LytH [Frankiaceae bacterium]